MTTTETHVGPIAYPAQFGANPDPLAWGQDPRPSDSIGAAIMASWFIDSPGTDYAPGDDYMPGRVAADRARIDCLRFIGSQYAGGSDD